nr:diguanylate cyclase [Lachnospiraceae bacterium]
AVLQDDKMKQLFRKAIYSLLVLNIFFTIRQTLVYFGIDWVDIPFAVIYIVSIAYYLRQIYRYYFRFFEYKEVPLNRTSRARFIAGCSVMIVLTAAFIITMVIKDWTCSPAWELVCWMPIMVFHLYASYLLVKRKKKVGRMAFYTWIMFFYVPAIIDIVAKAFAPELNASILAFCLFIPILYTGVQAQEGYRVVKALEENNMMHTILSALAYEFSTVVSVDLNTEEITIYKMQDRLRNTYGEFVTEKNYEKAMNMFVDRFVSEEDREPVRRQISIDFIKTHLDWPDNITLTYKNIIGRYGAQKIVRINKDVAVIGFVDRHDEIVAFNRQIYEDSLTKIRNRKFYEEKLKNREISALVMIDADNFKEINDAYGHVCGDIVLTALAGLLQVHVRSTDCVVRYGGDEFLIVFHDMPYKAFTEKMEVIRRAVENIRLTDYPDCRVTISMGGVFRRGTVEELIKIADNALYEAKDERNSITIIA